MTLRRILIGVTVVAMLSACSSSPSASTPPSSTATAGATATGIIPLPTATLPVTSPGPGQTPGATIAGDPVLAAMFPKLLAGQPVTVQTASILDFMHAFGATEEDIDAIRQSLAPIGLTLDTMIFGVGNATVTGSQISWQALRAPGQDVTKLVQNYKILELAESNTDDTVKQESVGGKTVTVVRDVEGNAILWMYVSGDVFWSLSTDDEDTAALVFAALP